MKLGIDIGSTTIKCVLLDKECKVMYKAYIRHELKIKDKLLDLLKALKNKLVSLVSKEDLEIAFSGSSAMKIVKDLDFKFVQEVYANKVAINFLNKDTNVAIELGGEDAKILFLESPIEIKMNGTCAGGTGAFIDQMATLLGVSSESFNNISKTYKKIFPIASRCGVFAKTDIQAYLNQGVSKNDIAKSVFNCVANQTIVGLSGGRKIEGNVLYLGGPLTFFEELRNSFDSVLNLKGICPKESLYYVSIGTALCADKAYNLDSILKKVENYNHSSKDLDYKPLFKSQKEYDEFILRHKKAHIIINHDKFSSENEEIFIGIDSGSTTAKFVAINKNDEIVFFKYSQNDGDPINLIKKFFNDFYEKNKNKNIKASASTGYGEDLIKNAFNLDFGVVETIAHLTAAKKLTPDVEFLIDIGGQDIKCFKVRNGVIEDIFLNEACSSGCGSFLQSFANSLNYSTEEFSKLGLFSKHPAQLGTRCTVFMNSSVKEAQKDGAKLEDISAGLSISVVKNALYKVIRITDKKDLGKKIVVQGGTFLNDAVLRAFEKELDINVVRSNISGLMGAFGAALYAKKRYKNTTNFLSSTVKPDALKSFYISKSSVNCKGCTNNCELSVSAFHNGKKYISGNKCEKPVAYLLNNKNNLTPSFNMYEFKLNLLLKYRDNSEFTQKDIDSNQNRVIGIPLVLNMYEMLPFWYAFFNSLGFKVIVSPVSNKDIYSLGKHTIPSDTVCYPAKLVHGHIISLLNMGIKNIFYPCMSYGLNEKLGDNYYNCPVVAYYPDLIAANIPEIKKVRFINEYVGVHRKYDFMERIFHILEKHFKKITLPDVIIAANKAYDEYERYRELVTEKGAKILRESLKGDKPVILLVGRPYHVDPGINRNVHKLISSLGFTVLSEDSIAYKRNSLDLKILNQWAYQARIYKAAEFALCFKNVNLVQLISFGCGTDSIVTDEVKRILKEGKKIYTGIKIDENSNLGAIKIRLRSLKEAILEKDCAPHDVGRLLKYKYIKILRRLKHAYSFTDCTD